MNNRVNSVIAAALVVIAFCLILIVFNTSAIAAIAAGQRAEKAVAQAEVPEEEVVQVIGRVTEVFDGIGADNGFLVTSGAELRVVHYDRGSMAAGSSWKPQYLKMVKFSNGKTVVVPITVE